MQKEDYDGSKLADHKDLGSNIHNYSFSEGTGISVLLYNGKLSESESL